MTIFLKKNHTLSSSYRYIFKIIYILTNLKIYHKKSKVNVKTSYLFGFNFLFQFSFKFHVLEKNKTCMKCKSVYVKFKRDQAVNLTHLYYLSRLVFSVLLVVFRLFGEKKPDMLRSLASLLQKQLLCGFEDKKNKHFSLQD